MPDKIFLHLLIICIIWSQKITGTIADEEIRESSDNLVRQKRVINTIPGEDKTVPVARVPYIVRIKQYIRVTCAGSILSQHVVITVALCVAVQVPQYYVLSGSSRLESGNSHTVIDIKKSFGHHPNRPTDGIALLTVNPPFVYGTFTNYIQLHAGPLLPGTPATISGWGFINNTRVSNHGTCHPRNLRSIEVSIMAHRDCVNRYRPHIEISDVDICTYHPQKRCGHLDAGAPLVIDGYLAGVRLWTGPSRIQHDIEYPDVFVILQHLDYRQWITANI